MDKELTANEEVCTKSMHNDQQSIEKITAYLPNLGAKEIEFIWMRLQGQSLDEICKVMKVSKTTACDWNSSLKINIKELELSTLSEKLRSNKQTLKDRVERSFGYLKAIDNSIAKKMKEKKLDDLSLNELVKMRSSMEKEIQLAGKALQFTRYKSELDDLGMKPEVVEPDL